MYEDNLERARNYFSLAAAGRSAMIHANAVDDQSIYTLAQKITRTALTEWAVVAFEADTDQAEAIADDLITESQDNGEDLAYCVGVLLQRGRTRWVRSNVLLISHDEVKQATT